MSPAEPESRELAEAVDELRDTVAALREDVQRTARTLPQAAPDEEPHRWLAVLEAPERRRPAIPRLLLEGLFLAACAAAAAIADLDAVAIAGVMVGAWALVALIEWAASRADRRREELLLAAPPTLVPVQPVEPAADAAWFSPPVEQTLLEVVDAEATGITRLPPRADDTVALAPRGDDTIQLAPPADDETPPRSA